MGGITVRPPVGGSCPTEICDFTRMMGTSSPFTFCFDDRIAAHMIRIAHLTSVHGRRDVRILYKECASLARAGHDVTLVVADGRGPEIYQGVRVIDVGAAGPRLKRMLIKPLSMFRAARQTDADVYHFHDPELLPTGLMLRLAGKHVIYDAHEDVPRQILGKSWIAPWLRRGIARLFEAFENAAAGRMSGVVAATPHIAARLSASNSVCVDVNNYPILAELSFREGYDTSTEAIPRSPTLCYVGAISENRGAIQMVQALEHLDVRCIMAGRIETTALQDRLQRLPGWSKVDYRGLVPRSGIQAILQESDIGLVLLHPIPNYLDSLPIKMFEYMAAGLPVVASDFPMWRAIVQERGVGACVDPLDTAAIVECIRRLVADPAGRQIMGRTGRVIVETERNWEQESGKLLALYERVHAVQN